MRKLRWKAALQFLADRMREPSSMTGFAVAIMALAHGQVTTDTVVAEAASAAVVLGVLAILMPEGGDDKC
jgi:isocitrate dehydrogenase kinase/phosphatase